MFVLLLFQCRDKVIIKTSHWGRIFDFSFSRGARHDGGRGFPTRGSARAMFIRRGATIENNGSNVQASLRDAAAGSCCSDAWTKGIHLELLALSGRHSDAAKDQQSSFASDSELSQVASGLSDNEMCADAMSPGQGDALPY